MIKLLSNVIESLAAVMIVLILLAIICFFVALDAWLVWLFISWLFSL